MSSHSQQSGFALIAVIVALGILLALCVPFAISMDHGATVSEGLSDQRKNEDVSLSLRTAALYEASQSHAAFDETPNSDGLGEFKRTIQLPGAIGELARDDNAVHLMAAEIEDLQRRFNLNTATPLVIANLLGLATHLSDDIKVDSEEIPLRNARNLPDSGYIMVDRELISYGAKDGNTLIEIERGLLAMEKGFLPNAPSAPHEIARGTLVLDFRTVLAVMHSFYFRGSSRDKLQRYESVAEINRIEDLGYGKFSEEHLDVLRRTCTVASVRETAADWGRPRRLFADVQLTGFPWQGVRLRVRDPQQIPGGTIVRIRTDDGRKQHTEYGLVWGTRGGGNRGNVNLAPGYVVRLLRPPSRNLDELEAYIEPLLPHPVNVNTAPREALAALMTNVRNDKPGHGATNLQPFSATAAERQADYIMALRGDGDAQVLADGPFQEVATGNFDSFKDFAKRWFEPQLADLGQRERDRFSLLYRALLGNGVGRLEMGAAPVSFTSGAVVSYRAASARTRGGTVTARHERSGIAVAMPAQSLDLTLYTQADFEEAFRLDRRAPFYTTFPISMGTYMPQTGANPPSRHWAHVVGMIFPDGGLGESRFPSQSGLTDGFKSATVHSQFRYRDEGRIVFRAQQSMWKENHPEGRDVTRAGPYEMWNNGSRGRGVPTPQRPQGGRSHDPSFPFTNQNGLVSRHAISFWFKPRDIGDQMLFDLAADDADRNRITVKLHEGHLVFEVFDEAGLDPFQDEINKAASSPQRTAGTWKLDLAEFNMQPETWYHVNISAEGNRPSQLTLLVDGVPRGDPELRTYLTRSIPEYIQPATRPDPFWSDQMRYPEVWVDSTEGFPPQGVLRIGLELFEYTSKTEKAFICSFDKSRGGRVARMRLREFSPNIPVNSQGRPTINLGNLQGGTIVPTAPPHEMGSAVELYGYTAQLYRNYDAQVGSGQLTSAVGPFAVARVLNNKSSIVLQLQVGSITLGQGYRDDDSDDIDLGDPDPKTTKPASNEIAGAFSETGGYALLVQRFIAGWSGGTGGGSIDIGGLELIRYSGRQGTRLTGIQRGVTVPPIQGKEIPYSQGTKLFDGKPRHFVAEWSPSIQVQPRGGGPPVGWSELPQFLAYVVPVSIGAQGTFIDPTVLDRTEWVQLLPQGDEADTEWVRYDYMERNLLMRTNLRAWRSLYFNLVYGNRPPSEQAEPAQGSGPAVQALFFPYADIDAEGVGYVGYIEQVETTAQGYPQINAARKALAFRGDPLREFSPFGISSDSPRAPTSHKHAAGTTVLQVHRFEFDWGNYGALSARVGRNDRVALVAGSQAGAGQSPDVEWYTVNWFAQRLAGDSRPRPGAPQPSSSSIPPERLGAYPMQLVAFKQPVSRLFIGPETRNFGVDTRVIDRLVKFPSGELPTAAPEDGLFGSSKHQELPELRGVIDELFAVTRRATPVLLDEAMSESAMEFLVRTDLLVTPQGETVINGNLTAQHPQEGGLVSINGEIMAYESHADGRFRIAREGRGLLGTEARHHDEGTLMYFIDQVPAAILTSSVNEHSYELSVNHLGDLPRGGGTLLLKSELLHYTWTMGDDRLGMPQWRDPEESRRRGQGLFRGRYGTVPASASSGEPVIWFPFRYWDRYHELADDPELSYFQITHDTAPVYFTGLRWEEEKPEQLIDVHCLVRIDGQAKWSDDPDASDALFLFSDPSMSDHVPNQIFRQGSRIEARFFTVYRPGAFDPQTYLSHAWKKAPIVRSRTSDDNLEAPALTLTYEGEGRILTERITAR